MSDEALTIEQLLRPPISWLIEGADIIMGVDSATRRKVHLFGTFEFDEATFRQQGSMSRTVTLPFNSQKGEAALIVEAAKQLKEGKSPATEEAHG